ncbi:MAG: helix-turn-helix domain-containing protein [Bacilli bacterium]|jgi:transcriptional regulator with XRE-family HTH domain
MRIGERIKGLYVSDGVSQAESARRCGLEPYELSRLVTGRRRPQLHQLQAIATAEGVELEELVVGTDAEHLLGQEPKLVSRSELEGVLQKALKAEEAARTLEAEKRALAEGLEASQEKARAAEEGVLEARAQAEAGKARLEIAGRKLGAAEISLALHKARQDASEKELKDLRERFSIGLAQYGQLRQAYQNIQKQHGVLWQDYEALAQKHAVEVHELKTSRFATAGLTGMLGLAFGALMSGDSDG